MAESGRTRRSSRPVTAPETASIDEPGHSRAEARRRGAAAATADIAAVIPAPLSRRARRIVATPTVAIDVVGAEPAAEVVLTEVAPTGDDAAQTPTVVASIVTDEVPAAVPRPTRRVRTAPVLLDPAEFAAGETVASEPPVETPAQAADEVFELVEPDLDADTPTETPVASGERPVLDEFEAAARLFSFTGETPIMRTAEEEPISAPAAAPHVPPRGRGKRGASFTRAATASFTVGVMGIVGLLAVGMTTPAEAVAAATGTGASASIAQQQLPGDVQDKGEIQAYVAPAQIQNTQIDRSGSYQTARLVDLAGTVGISNFSNAVFTNNPNCPVQWPFAVGVPISYGFGMRDGVMHEGVDFTPGDGSHIQAIADGVVRESTDSGGGYGVVVVIDHIIDGQLVSSRYGHMQYGSRQVKAGDKVSVGEYIGRTGDTGHSFGAHTHVEILLGGTTAIDPMPWFRQHATC